MRERYDELMEDTSYIDKVLADGASRARELASAKIVRLRKAMGF